MSDGAGDHYKGYYIKTVARAINPHSDVAILYEGSASISRDPAAAYDEVQAHHLAEDQAFPTEFEAHRYAERKARRHIDELEKSHS